jgi:hypothetical protein
VLRLMEIGVSPVERKFFHWIFSNMIAMMSDRL